MTTATYIEKDQNWMDETTVYWFDIDGLQNPEGFDYNGQYGVVDGRSPGIVHDDGSPVLNDWVRDQVEAIAVVTDDMRSE